MTSCVRDKFQIDRRLKKLKSFILYLFVDTSMKFTLSCIIALLSLKEASSFLKVLDDTKANCTGLVCEYSFIAWKEKIEILRVNNELRNIIADGYSADIVTAAINKLAWSEKLSALAQDQANRCPLSKVWPYAEKNGQCEYASAKRVRRFVRLHKNFSSFVNENRMMDLEGDLNDRTKRKLRRASAYSVGCGYVLRYHKDKFIEHFVCLYCYVNSKLDYISFNGNRSCQQDCLYENFTCDHFYNRLCSYEGKDGNIDTRHISNHLCPKMNLLTGSVLFWNSLTNNVICLLAAIFTLASITLGIGLAVYLTLQNYEDWKKYFVGKNMAAVEPQVLSTVESTVQSHSMSTLPLPAASTNDSATLLFSTDADFSLASANSLTTHTLPLQYCSVVLDPFPRQEVLKMEHSRENLVDHWQSGIKSKSLASAEPVTSAHNVDLTEVTSKRMSARNLAAQDALKRIQTGLGGRHKNQKNRVSDPIYGQCDSSGTNKRSRVATNVHQKSRQPQSSGGWRGL